VSSVASDAAVAFAAVVVAVAVAVAVCACEAAIAASCTTLLAPAPPRFLQQEPQSSASTLCP